MLSDPKHWDHILSFIQSGDVPHRIVLTDVDIHTMYVVDDHEDGDVSVDVVTTHSQASSKLRASGELPAPAATSNSGEKVRELSVSNLKQHLLAQALVHHKHVMHMPHDLLDPNPTNTADIIMMASRTYSTKYTWYVEYEVTGSPEQMTKYTGEVIQIPAVP